MAEIRKCACGKRIRPCACGGSACPGWRHLSEWGSHWCGTLPQDGQATPALPPGSDRA